MAASGRFPMSGPKVKQDSAIPLLFDNRLRAMADANGPGGRVRGTLGTGGRRLRPDGLRSAAAPMSMSAGAARSGDRDGRTPAPAMKVFPSLEQVVRRTLELLSESRTKLRRASIAGGRNACDPGQFMRRGTPWIPGRALVRYLGSAPGRSDRRTHESGHGNNVELKAMFEARGRNYCRRYWRFLLLESHSGRVADDMIAKRDDHWKQVLQSRGGIGSNRKRNECKGLLRPLHWSWSPSVGPGRK